MARTIKTLPRIPTANVNRKLRPENLLSPLLFALDPRIRFPLINGNAGVKALLSSLGVVHAPVDEQYVRMIELYGKGGIVDAADLDQVGGDLRDFIAVGAKRASKKLLKTHSVDGSPLPIKDEGDIETLQKARTVTHRKLHNALTNALRRILASFTLFEGCDDNVLFDVLVKEYNGHDDLLIEAKSSIERAQIRMAVGQLFDYWFNLKGTAIPHLAILTPNKPPEATIEMLHWLDIGVLWIDQGVLRTCTERLREICKTLQSEVTIACNGSPTESD